MFFNNEFKFDDINVDTTMNNDVENNFQNLQGVNCPSICECPRERCFQRQIHHCVEHIVPINTKIVNHHIYHHVYKPVYTCTEKNICSQDNNCCM